MNRKSLLQIALILVVCSAIVLADDASNSSSREDEPDKIDKIINTLEEYNVKDLYVKLKNKLKEKIRNEFFGFLDQLTDKKDEKRDKREASNTLLYNSKLIADEVTKIDYLNETKNRVKRDLLGENRHKSASKHRVKNKSAGRIVDSSTSEKTINDPSQKIDSNLIRTLKFLYQIPKLNASSSSSPEAILNQTVISSASSSLTSARPKVNFLFKQLDMEEDKQHEVDVLLEAKFFNLTGVVLDLEDEIDPSLFESDMVTTTTTNVSPTTILNTRYIVMCGLYF